jgi:hypothetical protein
VEGIAVLGVRCRWAALHLRQLWRRGPPVGKAIRGGAPPRRHQFGSRAASEQAGERAGCVARRAATSTWPGIWAGIGRQVAWAACCRAWRLMIIIKASNKARE